MTNPEDGMPGDGDEAIAERPRSWRDRLSVASRAPAPLTAARAIGGFLTRAIDLTFDEDLQRRRRTMGKALVAQLGTKAPKALELDYMDWVRGSTLIDDRGEEARKKHLQAVVADPTYDEDVEGRTLAILAVICTHEDARYLKNQRISSIIDTGKRI